MADFTVETKEEVHYVNHATLPPGTVIDIQKDGTSLPGFPKTVPAGKEFEARLAIDGKLKPV